MPFKSEAQRRWMHANKPEMADRWEEHTPKGKKLPKKVSSESLLQRIDQVLAGESHPHVSRQPSTINAKLDQILATIEK